MTWIWWAVLGAGVGFVISVAAGLVARGPFAPRSTDGTRQQAAGQDGEAARLDRVRDGWCVLGGAIVFAGVGTNHPWLLVPLLPSLLVWAAIADVDARTRLIPNRANQAAAIAAAIVVAAGGYAIGWRLAYLAVVAALAMGLLYFVLALLPSGVGGGDLKLAPSTAAVCATVAPSAPVMALILAFIATAVYGVIALARTRGTRHAVAAMRIPHGPFMIMGAVLAIATS